MRVSLGLGGGLHPGVERAAADHDTPSETGALPLVPPVSRIKLRARRRSTTGVRHSVLGKGRRLRAGGARRRRGGHPLRRLPAGHARPDRAPPATLVPFDDLSLYEIEEGGDSLKPVFAVGDWVEEIMAEEISVASGVTGWVVRNRRTRNVPNTLLEPLCTVVSRHRRGRRGVRRRAADRPRPRRRLAQRLPHRRRRPVHRRRGRARRALRDDGRAGLRLRPAARPAARGGPHGQPHRPAQPPRQPGAPARGARRRRRAAGRASSSSTSTTSSASTTPSATPRATARWRSPPRALRDVVRESDAVGRLGGEEFVLVLPGVDAAAAREAAERARVAISEVQIGGRQLACSAGLACHPRRRRRRARLLDGRRRRALRRQGHGPRAHLPLPPEPRAAALAGRGARGGRGDPARAATRA